MHRVLLVLALPMVACLPTSDDSPDELPPPPLLSAPLDGVNPGDVVARGMVSAIAPPPGEEVFAEAIDVTGKSLTLHLRTDPDGSVGEVIDDVSTEAPDEPDALAAASACGTNSHTLLGYRWSKRYDWYYNAGSTPSYLGVDFVVAALRRAMTNITQSQNTCGLADRVSFDAQYQGTRATSANISTGGGCTAPDGINVTGFGDLPSGILAVTCTWSAGGSARESDARINKGDHTWYAQWWSGCTKSFGIEAVMTHERGHTAGLGHSGGAQTMAPAIGPCTDAPATLGSGDVAGLRRLY